MRLRRRLILLVVPVLVWSIATTFGGGTVTPIQRAEAHVDMGDGYWMAASDGGMFAFGDAGFHGSLGDVTLNRPIVGMAATPFLEGYWLVASDGGVFSFGSAGFHGSTGNMTLNSPIVGMAAHPHGLGYWLVAADGGVFNFGDAGHFGSAGGQKLNKPIVGIAPTPTGNGYWLVATDGGIFNYGDAEFLGSAGNLKLNRPVVGIETSPSANGYYLVASDGGIFNYGDAEFKGSAGGLTLNAPIVGMEYSANGQGYQLVATDGGIFAYGGAPFFGSTGDRKLNKPILGMAVRPRLAIVADAFANTTGQTSEWEQVSDDWQLSLNRTGGSVPAGARIYGADGLDIDQLGNLSFRLESGACTNDLLFALYYDIDGDGDGDGNVMLRCPAGGAGNLKSFDPVAAGAPANADVTALDIWWSGTGDVNVDEITVAGVTVDDFRPGRLAA